MPDAALVNQLRVDLADVGLVCSRVEQFDVFRELGLLGDCVVLVVHEVVVERQVVCSVNRTVQ